jgi:hypothetical protein
MRQSDPNLIAKKIERDFVCLRCGALVHWDGTTRLILCPTPGCHERGCEERRAQRLLAIERERLRVEQERAAVQQQVEDNSLKRWLQRLVPTVKGH